jgi:hypothetical protein
MIACFALVTSHDNRFTKMVFGESTTDIAILFYLNTCALWYKQELS